MLLNHSENDYKLYQQVEFFVYINTNINFAFVEIIPIFKSIKRIIIIFIMIQKYNFFLYLLIYQGNFVDEILLHCLRLISKT